MEYKGIALLFLQPLRRRLAGVQRKAPIALRPGQRPPTHCTGGWVGPRTCLDGYRKSRPHRDSVPGLSVTYPVNIFLVLFIFPFLSLFCHLLIEYLIFSPIYSLVSSLGAQTSDQYV